MEGKQEFPVESELTALPGSGDFLTKSFYTFLGFGAETLSHHVIQRMSLLSRRLTSQYGASCGAGTLDVQKVADCVSGAGETGRLLASGSVPIIHHCRDSAAAALGLVTGTHSFFFSLALSLFRRKSRPRPLYSPILPILLFS